MLCFKDEFFRPFKYLAITAVDGVELDPIEPIGVVVPPGRPGWGLVRFDGRDLAEAILQVRPDASEVAITIKAPIDNRTELVGEAILGIRSFEITP